MITGIKTGVGRTSHEITALHPVACVKQHTVTHRNNKKVNAYPLIHHDKTILRIKLFCFDDAMLASYVYTIII
jgi:hypothetical protein